jgi:hypothetical protein
MEWRKSSRSGAESNCVEVRRDLAGLRDSKRPAAGIEVPVDALRSLVAWSRRG